jgi:hypothetical protein
MKCRFAILSLSVFLAQINAQGAFQLFTDRTSWETAVMLRGGATGGESFNSFPDQSFSSSTITLEHFSISTNSVGNQANDINSIDAAPFGDGGFDRNVDNTTYVLGGFGPGEIWQITFGRPVVAFGWDSKQDFDGDWLVGGVAIAYPNPTFFGVVDDSSAGFTTIRMTGWDSTFGTDNYVYAFPGVPGDYNNDGSVDAADYVVWRKNVGGPANSLPNNADGGPIRAAHFDTWRANFGMAESGSAARSHGTVPEPTSYLILIVATSTVIFTRNRRTEHNHS